MRVALSLASVVAATLLTACTTGGPGTGASAGSGEFFFVPRADLGGGLTGEITARGSSEGVVKVRGGTGPAAQSAGLAFAARKVCSPGGRGAPKLKPGTGGWKVRSNGTYVATFVCS